MLNPHASHQKTTTMKSTPRATHSMVGKAKKAVRGSHNWPGGGGDEGGGGGGGKGGGEGAAIIRVSLDFRIQRGQDLVFMFA